MSVQELYGTDQVASSKPDKLLAEEKDRNRTKNARENHLMEMIKQRDVLISDLVELKPERDRLQIKLEKAESSISNLTNKVVKYQKEIDALKELNKKLHLEKNDIQHQKESIVDLYRHTEVEIKKVNAQNAALTNELRHLRIKEEAYIAECSCLRVEVKNTTTTDINLVTLEKQYAELKGKYQDCMHKLDESKNMLIGEKKLVKGLKIKHEENLTNLRSELDRAQTNIKLLKQEKVEIKIELEQSKNSNLGLKKIQQEKDNQAKAQMTIYKNEIGNLRTMLGQIEELYNQEKVKRNKADSDNQLLLEKMAIEKKKTNNAVAEEKTLQTKLCQTCEELEAERSAKQLLEVELKKLKEKEKEERLSFGAYKDKTEQQLNRNKIGTAKLQAVIDSQQKDLHLLQKKITSLCTEKENLRNAVSKTKSESLKSTFEIKSALRGLLKMQKQRDFGVKRIKREASHRLKRCNRKRRDSYLWGKVASKILRETMSQVMQQSLHEPCVSMIDRLEKQNYELQETLSRRMKKSEDTFSVLKANCSFYKNKFLEEQVEKEYWKQKAQEQNIVRINPVQTSPTEEEKPNKSYKRPVFNIYGQCVINSHIAVVNMDSETSQRTSVNVNPIRTKIRAAHQEKPARLPPIKFPKL